MFNEVYGDLTSLMEIKVEAGNSVDTTLKIITIVMIVIIVIIIASVMFISIRTGKGIARQISNGLCCS